MRASFIHITQGFRTIFEIVAEKDLLPRILASASSSPLESRDELDNISCGLVGEGEVEEARRSAAVSVAPR